MNYVFGPVPSRRLGMSLGIDPIPLKTCNWNCVYCQLGRTVPLSPTRGDFAPADVIVEELREALLRSSGRQPDWVTFVGSGEPTLHRELGWMIREAKAITGIPVAVITNGSFLSDPAVRMELLAADAVLPTLDAGDAILFKAINRPHPWFSFERHLGGLRDFRQFYTGKLWLEVMLLRHKNDSEEALQALSRAIRHIQPDQVHLSLPLRGPAEPWVQPADAEALARAVRILGEAARVLPPIPEGVVLSGSETPAVAADLADAVLRVIRRHPMEQQELIRTIEALAVGRSSAVLDALSRSGRAQAVSRFGKRFWTASSARFVQRDAVRGSGSPASRPS